MSDVLKINFLPEERRTSVLGHFWSPSNEPVKYLDSTDKSESLRECKLFIVGLYPGKDEESARRNFVGPAGKIFVELSREILNSGFNSFFRHVFITNFIKNKPKKDRNKDVSLSAEDKKYWRDLLIEEINKVKPKNILILGDLPLKCLLKHSFKLNDFYGSFYSGEIEGVNHKVTLYALSNPVNIIYNPNLLEYYKRGLSYVYKSILNTDEIERVEDKIVVVDDEYLRELFNKILNSENKIEKVSIDMEWFGNFPSFNGYKQDKCGLICFQIYNPTIDKCIYYEVKKKNNNWIPPLRDLLLSSKVQVSGHFLQTDNVWLNFFGIPLYRKCRYIKYEEINTIDDFDKLKIFDTSLAYHSLDENSSLDLCNLAVRELGVSRWDQDIDFEKEIDRDKLLLYACKDVFYTYKLVENAKTKLIEARKNLPYDPIKPFINALNAFPAFMEMMVNGIKIDRKIANDYISKFNEFLSNSEDQMRSLINWKEFNPNSHEQCSVIIFGRKAVPNKDADEIVPKDVKTYDIQTIKETENGAASTSKLVLSYLRKHNEFCNKLFNYRTIYKAKDIVNKLLEFLNDDDKIITFITQTKETGRSSSSRPNLQNMPNSVEHIYEEIMGKYYPGKIRDLFCVNKDEVFISADISGAEIFVGAVASGDVNLIEDYYLQLLPDDDPKHVDIPSKLVVDAYGLKIRPTKKSLKENKLSYLRDAAKRVIYGLAYGATEYKIFETLSLEGIDITLDQVYKLIDSLKNNYKERFLYNEKIKSWIRRENYLVNCYGRIRHFEKINKLIASNKNDVNLHAEREAINFIPQSTVADVMNQVLSQLFFDEYVRVHAKILLQIHDEVLLSCKKEFADYVSNKVVSIIKSVPIFRCHFDGTRLDNKNYYFGAGVSVASKWSKD